MVWIAVWFAPATQLHTIGNTRERRPSASRFEMPGVKRVFDIVAFRVSTAEGAVKLLKSDKPALGTSVNVRGAVTVQAVQLVVGVVIVQGAGDILCILLLGKSAAVINVHNGGIFAAFGIADRGSLSPVAVTAAARVGRRVAVVGKEAGFLQGWGDFCRAVLSGLVVFCGGVLVIRCGELHRGVSALRNCARPQLAVSGGVGDFVHCHGFDSAAV